MITEETPIIQKFESISLLDMKINVNGLAYVIGPIPSSLMKRKIYKKETSASRLGHYINSDRILLSSQIILEKLQSLL